MARENKLLTCGISKDEIMREWNLGGDNRQAICQRVGFASVNGMYNAMRAVGWIDGGPVSGGDSGKRASSGKIKGCLPIKVQARIAKELGLDMEEHDIGWDEWLLVSQGDATFEGLSMARLAGGEDSEGGKAYRAWIDSNRAADKARAAAVAKAAEAAARAADPTFQLKEQLSRYSKMIVDRDIEIKNLKAELESAKRASGGRGPRMGGELTQDMLRIMKQRFHPDKNNGSPELCTAVMQWLNAIEL